MSKVAIRAALETALKAVDPNFPTAWENYAFDTPNGPYQEVWLLFTRPFNGTWGNGPHRQRGYLQVSLKYPTNEGPGNAAAKADALERAFFRGLSLEAEGVTTIIEETPEVPAGAIEGDRYVINVRIRFYADIIEEG